MSDIERNEQDRMHQLLCAYVLGEADAGERAEVEKALAADAGLREERDRIAATVGLVQGALGKDEVLSWRATSEVTRAAAQAAAGPVPAPRAWYRSPSLRAAASIVALVGASFVGWQAFVGKERAALRSSVDLAAVPPPHEPESPVELDRLRGLGYLGSSAPAEEVDAASRAALKKQVPPPSGPAGATEAKREGARGEEFAGLALDALAQREAELQDRGDVDHGELHAPVAEGDGGAAHAGAGAPDVIHAVRSGGSKEGLSVLDLNGFGESSGNPVTDPNQAGAPGAQPAPAEAPPRVLSVGQSGGIVSGAPSEKPKADTYAGLPAPGAAMPPGSPAPTAGGGSGGVTYGLGKATGGKSAAASAPAAQPPAAGLDRRLADDASRDDEAPVSATATKELQGLGYVEARAIEIELGHQLEIQEESVGLTPFEQVDRFAQDKDQANARVRQQRVLTPEEREARLERILASCRRLPHESPRDMFFRFWGDNPFEWAANDRQSTFSMDVDTASYALARRYLVENHLPEKAQIRTEEFVNYFRPDVAPPSAKQGTFAIATELAPSRYSDPRDGKWMLRVAVRGREIPQNERAPLALTMVVDVSGSMQEQNRLELVKHAIRQLVTQLDPRDSIAIVAFSNDTRLILPMTSAGKRSLIESAIEPLRPEGGTNTEAGLRMGYEQAVASLTKNATNRVVLLTDGVANVGITDPNVLVQSVESQRKAGIYLNTIGVGMNNHNDHLLEQLADKGDGLCNYVDDAAEVKRVLVEGFLKALVPIARDAKVQVEFDPAQVESYRLLGYENRAIADRDFRNDKVDAGEINSGHQVTALYEIVRAANPAVATGSEAPLAKVSVRFKPPHQDGVAQAGSEEATEISAPVHARDAAASYDATSYGYRRAVVAAQFAEFLRRSVHARGDSLDGLIADANRLASEKPDQETGELRDMIVKSKGLLDAALLPPGRFEAKLHDLRQKCFERERLQSLRRDLDRERLRILDEEVASLERDLRQLFETR